MGISQPYEPYSYWDSNRKIEFLNQPVNQIETTLQTFLQDEEMMPQAYLFLGSSQDKGNARVIAENFASQITGQKLPNIDIVVYDAAVESGIAQLREVMQLASLMPANASRKAVIMFNMDLANVQMQNALLKILEEPPKQTVFLMVSSLPMLPTIMSRCQVFTVPRGDTEVIVSEELVEAINFLEAKSKAGIAEKIALVSTLAEYDEVLLNQLLENWLRKQVLKLKQAPQNYKAVRATMETMESLRGNFNKKMVLQKFVTTAL